MAMLDIYYLWSKSLYQVNSPNTHHQVCRRPSSTKTHDVDTRKMKVHVYRVSVHKKINTS